MKNQLPLEKITRKVYTKKESQTNLEYGVSPEDRTITELLNNGVICLNKPQGPSSHQITEYAKNILEADKAGHGGTLDPNVTGVLPIALGKASRVLRVLLLAGKEYVCLMHLHKDISEDIIRKELNAYIGKITQLPPVKSAVKRVHRQREIYYIDIIEIDGRDVLFRVGCQAGTYIRKICFDFGKKLNMGANMQELIRTKAGPFNEKEIYSLQDLQEAFLLYSQERKEKELRKIIKPVEFAIKHLPKIWVHDSAVNSICHGIDLSIPGISKLESDIKENDLIAVLTLKNELVCIGNSLLTSEDIIKNDKGKVLKTERVFLDLDLYPKWKKNTD